MAAKKGKPKYSAAGRRLYRGLKQVEAHLRGDAELPVRQVVVTEPVDVKAIRKRTGLSQADFAERYGFSMRSLQEWEQGRRKPESAVRAYLTVIDRDPKAVEKALRKSA